MRMPKTCHEPDTSRRATLSEGFGRVGMGGGRMESKAGFDEKEEIVFFF